MTASSAGPGHTRAEVAHPDQGASPNSLILSLFGGWVNLEHIERLLAFRGWPGLIDHGQIVLQQREIGGRCIFLSVLDGAGLGDCNDRLSQAPGKCDLGR